MKINNADPVLCARDESLALVTINRADRLNTLDLATIQELTRIFSELRRDPAVRSVILTGSGAEAFSAGAELTELAGLTAEEARGYAQAGQTLTALVEDLGKPVIAAIGGLASGGGCELAMACTWRIATAAAKFALPEAKLGLMPGFGGSTRLPRLIGKAAALEMILTGEPIAAEDAARLGLIDRVVGDRDQLAAASQELARQIGRNAPLAVKYALEAVNHGSEKKMVEGLRLESALFSLCFATKDVREGIAAFLEKRHPNFEGK